MVTPRRFFFLAALAFLPAIACTKPANETRQIPPTPESIPKYEPGTAFFAGGCFWGVEHYLEALEGVSEVSSGYMGGHVNAPTYEQVSSHDSGHLETVRVRFDPEKTTFEIVAKLFFEIHDPTQANGQGPDIGPQYLSAVFFTSPEQKATSEALIDRLRKRNYNVVTEIRPAGTFWSAESYHQDYYKRNGKKPYCHTRVKRFED